MLELQQKSTMHEAYIAGLIDAMGTIGIRNGKEQIQPYILIRHKSKVFVNNIAKLIGFGKTFHYGGRYYACQCFGTKTVCDILTNCVNFLQYRKKVAELVLKFCTSRLNNSYQPLNVYELKLVNEISHEVRKR